jgi:hypothetical protein
MSPLDIFGWIGSGAVVFSLLQSNMLRLRIISLVACIMVVAYSLLIEAWPMVGMNASIALINVYYLIRMRQSFLAHKAAMATGSSVAEEEIAPKSA